MNDPKQTPFERDADGRITSVRLEDESGQPYTLADALAGAPAAEREEFTRLFGGDDEEDEGE